MKKYFLIFSLILGFCLCNIGFCDDDDSDEWTKHLDVYTSDGLDKPVNAIDFKKTMDELDKLKERSRKKKSWWNRNKMPEEPMTTNEPVTIERNDIVKITTPLYYDGKILPIGFYKIACEEINGEYFFNLIQGKTTIMQVKGRKTSHMEFCPDKVNCLETNVYQKKYFKINYKTIDYAVTGYLAIVE